MDTASVVPDRHRSRRAADHRRIVHRLPPHLGQVGFFITALVSFSGTIHPLWPLAAGAPGGLNGIGLP